MDYYRKFWKTKWATDCWIIREDVPRKRSPVGMLQPQDGRTNEGLSRGNRRRGVREADRASGAWIALL